MHVVPFKKLNHKINVLFGHCVQEILDEFLYPEFLVELADAVKQLLVALNDRVDFLADTVGLLVTDQLDKMLLETLFVPTIVTFVGVLSGFRHFDVVFGV